MSCTSDPPSCSLREADTRAAQQRARAGPGPLSRFCLALRVPAPSAARGRARARNQAGGGARRAPVQAARARAARVNRRHESIGGKVKSGARVKAEARVAEACREPVAAPPPVVLSKGGVMLRLLTRAEYLTSIQSLLGTLTTQLAAPEDISVAGFVSVGAANVSDRHGGDGVRNREPGSDCRGLRANTTRWQKLVGCAPKADLSDACVTTYIKNFGRSRLPTRPHRRRSDAVARGGQERGEAGGYRRVRAADGDVRTASIAELPLSGRDQQGRQQQRSPEVRRVVDGESPLVLADRRATQRGSADCRNIGSARHRRRRPHRRCSLLRAPASRIA